MKYIHIFTHDKKKKKRIFSQDAERHLRREAKRKKQKDGGPVCFLKKGLLWFRVLSTWL